MSLRRLGIAVALLFTWVDASYSAPGIEITSVPPYGTLGYLHGRVSGVSDPNLFRVATYIQP